MNKKSYKVEIESSREKDSPVFITKEDSFFIRLSLRQIDRYCNSFLNKTDESKEDKWKTKLTQGVSSDSVPLRYYQMGKGLIPNESGVGSHMSSLFS